MTPQPARTPEGRTLDDGTLAGRPLAGLAIVLIENGEIVFEDGEVVFVGPRLCRREVARRIDYGNALIGPGLRRLRRARRSRHHDPRL